MGQTRRGSTARSGLYFRVNGSGGEVEALWRRSLRLLVPEQAGYYKLEWDGRDASGARVATGVYLYGLRAGDFRSVRKMVLMK